MTEAHNKFPESLGREIATLYGEGVSAVEIAKRFGCCPSSVVNWAHRCGVRVKHPKECLPKIETTQKKCKGCGEVKATEGFYKCSANRDGFQGKCKTCEHKRRSQKNPNWVKIINDQSRKRVRENPREARSRGLRRRFGITLEEFDRLFDLQNRQCPACGRKESESDARGLWHVDHDHRCCSRPGKACGKCIRGILCRGCNIILGIAQDNPTTLRNLATYIENNALTK